MGSPDLVRDLVRWLRDPGSPHFYVACHVDLCVYVYCLVVKGTIASLVLSSMLREEKGERSKGGFLLASLPFYIGGTALTGQNHIIQPSLIAGV